MKQLLILLVSSILLISCAKTPMDKLKSDTVYSELNTAYWMKEMNANTPLWQEASTYCGKHQAKLNCRHIFDAEFLKTTPVEISGESW